ncbi:U-box domain-containing protein [uncultured Legionella sp.]|uniref:U-box domain-containing protein n=1 Tax=uncultured Legionella sp. TaxID=210934 RepID=UPI00260CC5EA|nr:U-box domain-containing protein [uncultured Legionella sp.]
MQMKHEVIKCSEVQKLFTPMMPSSVHPLHLEGLEVILNMQAGDFSGKSVFQIELMPNKTFRLHCHQNPTALAVFMEKLNPTFKIGKTTQGFFIDLEQGFVVRVKFKLCEINLDQIPEPVLCKLPTDLEKEHLAAINFCFAKNPLLKLEFRKTHYNPNTKESSGPLQSIMFKFPPNAKQADFTALTEKVCNDLGRDVMMYSGLARDKTTYCFELNASSLQKYYQNLINSSFVKSAVELSQSQLLNMNGLFHSQVVEAPAPAAPVVVEIPNQYLCPISMELMTDPVISEDGYTYERNAITQALKARPVSPITQAPVNPDLLIPNRALKELIEQFIKDHPEIAQDNMALPFAPNK